MSIIEQLNRSTDSDLHAPYLKQGGKVRIKNTGQIVELKSISEHGISKVEFRTGSQRLISNKFLEPLNIH